MEAISDRDSLFGDDGDTSDCESLFGSYDKGHADIWEDGGLEAELAAMLAEGSAEPDLTPEPSLQQSTVSQPATKLSLPSMALPSPEGISQSTSLLTLHGAPEAEALTSPRMGCVAVPVRTASIQSDQSLTALSLALPSRPFSEPIPSRRTPTVPDPPDVPLSRQDGHTSGSSVVSTQHLTHLSPAASTQASEDEEAELEALMEWELLQDQNVNSTSPHFGDHEGLGLDPKLIPGNRYAKTYTRGRLRPPRRIDLDEAKAEILEPFVFFRNTTRITDLYTRLELNLPEGKKLGKALKMYLRSSPFDVLVSESAEANTSKGKESLVRTALHILSAEGWGETWFGRHCATATTRKQLWPADSTLITLNFTVFLHKIIRTEKQVLRNQARKNKDRWGSESVTSTTSDTSSRNLSVTPQPRGDGPVLLDALVRNVATNKQRVQQSPSEEPVAVDVPDDAELTYRVYVKDRITGVDLSAPTVYQHSNHELSAGAYAYLKSSLEAAGYSPIVMIHTASKHCHINNQADWDSAVRDVYWWRSRGGVVEVDILV